MTRAGGGSRHDRSGLLQHRGGLGSRVRRGAHGWPGHDWTTLQDLNGHTTQSTGESCKAENAGRLAHAPPVPRPLPDDVGDDCAPTGTTGEWNAASNGDSGDWQQWRSTWPARADASASRVEVSISYASDWATQGLGVFVDDIARCRRSDAAWQHVVRDRHRRLGCPGARGERPEREHWAITDSAGFPEGATSRARTPPLGLRPRGRTGAATRNALMARAIDYLRRP